MVYCANCGMDAGESNFCPNCGSKIIMPTSNVQDNGNTEK